MHNVHLPPQPIDMYIELVSFGLQAVYFVKRRADVVKKDTFKTLIAFGDVSHLPLDQLNSMVESVRSSVPHSMYCDTLPPLLCSWCSPL